MEVEDAELCGGPFWLLVFVAVGLSWMLSVSVSGWGAGKGWVSGCGEKGCGLDAGPASSGAGSIH